MALVPISGTTEVLVDSSALLTELPPTITVAPTSSITMRVTFSKPMFNDANLADPSSYTVIGISPGAAAVLVNSVTPEGVGEPTFVDLDITEMTDAATYEMAVAAGVKDPAGLSVDAPAQFTGQGLRPSVVSAVALSSRKVRVTFDEIMDTTGSGLSDPANYTVTPTTPGAGPVFVSTAVPVGADPVAVDLATSEQKEGASYDAQVDSSGPVRDSAFNPVDPASDTAVLTGVGVKPTLLQVAAVGKTRVDLKFSEPMRDNPDIRVPGSYVWATVPPEPEDDITTLAVLSVEEDTVKLVTNEQTPGVQYDLTIG